jgi:predicted alpha/beta superfamily hydrolase
MNIQRMAAICLVAFCDVAGAQEIVPGKLDTNERILLDTICDGKEWAKASRTRLNETSELLAAQDAAAIYLCVTLPPESYGTTDLYVIGANAGAPTNLHASAQIGERIKGDAGWPDWVFGRHSGWYSPPVALSEAKIVEGQSRPRLTFTNAGGREIAIEKAKFGGGPWRFMIEVRSLGADKRGSLNFPANGKPDDPSTWASLRIDNVDHRSVTAEAQVFEVFSMALGESRSVWVSAPAECTTEKRCPVLYVLDAHALFPIATSYAAVMARMGRMDPLVVVGLPSASQANRARDFIPVEGVTEAERERLRDARGAARFGEFLQKELAPLVRMRFPVSDERTLAGHSLAGLYAVHSLGSADTFSNLIALSPSLGWAEEGALRAFLDSLKTPRNTPRKFFASVAGGDTQGYHTAFNRLSTGVSAAKAGWLKHRLKRYSDEDHVTTVAPALQDAMKWLYVRAN